jgi:hypothetical protein
MVKDRILVTLVEMSGSIDLGLWMGPFIYLCAKWYVSVQKLTFGKQGFLLTTASFPTLIL